MPWTSTCTSDFSTWNRDVHAGHALVSPGPSYLKRSRINLSESLPSGGRCPSSKRFPKPTIPDQDSHKIPLSARAATSDYDGISEEKTESLRISLGGASALTGHRQDARLVRIDAAGPAASFEFGLRPCR